MAVVCQVLGGLLLVAGAALLSPVAAVLLAGCLLLAAGTLAELAKPPAPGYGRRSDDLLGGP